LLLIFNFVAASNACVNLLAGSVILPGSIFQGDLSASLAPQYRHWLDEEKVCLLQLGSRQQGLMAQKNNPLKLKDLTDLTRRSIRFINRQKDSGTRTIFDELLRHAGISKTRIRGYDDEEFTHLAVAAMLASGAVDAGFGIKAAASKFGLHFIPVVVESYVLAISREVSSEVVAEFQGLLRSDGFIRKLKSLPGYLPANTGNVISTEKLLAGE